MSTQYRLKEDWKPVGGSKAMKKLADWMNEISMQFNRAEVVSGGTARPTDMGLRIEVDGSDAENWAFHTTLSGNTVSWTDGAIVFPDQAYDVGANNLTLTGATEYVYVYLAKNLSGTAGVAHASTFPLSNGSNWVWALAKYTATSGGYSLTQRLYRGNIYVYVPIR